MDILKFVGKVVGFGEKIVCQLLGEVDAGCSVFNADAPEKPATAKRGWRHFATPLQGTNDLGRNMSRGGGIACGYHSVCGEFLAWFRMSAFIKASVSGKSTGFSPLTPTSEADC